MNILVIKQTSLGDVLHASGHIRAIKEQYPGSKLTVLTANTSVDIYRHNPWIDELILIDRYGIKENWYKKPIWAIREFQNTLTRIRRQKFDLAIDLQGLAKTMIFLYAAKADRKFVKGNWLGVKGFRNKKLHAIKEMDNVLLAAGISPDDTTMEFETSVADKKVIDDLMLKINPNEKPVLIISPYSRWPSKDWPLESYIEVCGKVSDFYQVVFTGAPERRADIEHGLEKFQCKSAVNLAGTLSLGEFAELASRAALMLTGDSFPMHVAGAKKLPVIALFGPTDERKVGPRGKHDRVIRVKGCKVCDNKICPRHCLSRLPGTEVTQAVRDFDPGNCSLQDPD